MDFEPSPLCGVCQLKETPSHYLLGCNKFKKERKVLLSNITSVLSKNKIVPQNFAIEKLLGQQNFSKGDLKLSEKKLKNTVLPLTINFKNLLVFYFVKF